MRGSEEFERRAKVKSLAAQKMAEKSRGVREEMGVEELCLTWIKIAKTKLIRGGAYF